MVENAKTERAWQLAKLRRRASKHHLLKACLWRVSVHIPFTMLRASWISVRASQGTSLTHSPQRPILTSSNLKRKCLLCHRISRSSIKQDFSFLSVPPAHFPLPMCNLCPSQGCSSSKLNGSIPQLPSPPLHFRSKLFTNVASSTKSPFATFANELCYSIRETRLRTYFN